MARADKSALVSAAVEAFRRGEYVTPTAAAKAKGCHPTAVQRRLRGLTKTRREANSYWHQCLTNIQEELLINRIDILTDKGIPPTSQFVKNLAEEIRGREVGKNWVAQFCARHKIKLKSAYLRNLDNLRVSAERVPLFVLFFTMVMCSKCLNFFTY
jgi:hypothetical protein